MNKELNMIGSTEEDRQMMEIIKDNCLKTRIENEKKSKKLKRNEIIMYIMMFVSSGIFMIGLMYFIAVIENLKF